MWEVEIKKLQILFLSSHVITLIPAIYKVYLKILV